MDAVAFNTFTEFFTHTHSMCHFLQSEAWQSRAESTIHRLTESSAGVAEQLQSTQQMAEDLIEAQSVALQAQQEILNNGEELRVTLRDSTQGLRAVFSELSSVSREQQVALSELFNRVSFLQSFLLMEAHSLSSCCYNAAALCTSFLITSTQRSSRARLLLLSLVCLNFYLERKIYLFIINSDLPEHTHMEVVSAYVGVCRRVMVCVGVCVLLCVCVRYKDPVQQSLQVLQQLRETQRSLQEVLQHAEALGEDQRRSQSEVKRRLDSRGRRQETLRRTKEIKKQEEEKEEEEEEEERTLVCPTTGSSDRSHLSVSGWSEDSLLSSTLNSSAADSTLRLNITHNASVTSVSRLRGSPEVYSLLVEDRQPRYSLRSRRSETH